jgi:hypothetical protein
MILFLLDNRLTIKIQREGKEAFGGYDIITDNVWSIIGFLHNLITIIFCIEKGT